MDTRLFERLNKDTPKFNPRIAEGFAMQEVKFAEQYIDRIFRCAQQGFPRELEYLDCKRCTPSEEYRQIVRLRNSQRTYEITRSDIYMMKYRFAFRSAEGEERIIERFLCLPYLQDGGLLTLRGSTFAVSPVLADRAISVGSNSIFIPLTIAKVTFEREIQHFLKNGQRESVYVIWSPLHNNRAGQPSVRGRPTLMHYLFCKMGVTRAFSEHGNCDIVVGYADEINEENYPTDKFVICGSTNIKPRRLKVRNYIGSKLRMAVPKEQYNNTVASMIGGFFYVVDYFPERIEPDYIDEPRLWKTLLGHLTFPAGDSEGKRISEGKYVEDIDLHLQSLDRYIDEIVKEDLREDGVYCDDIYGLFVYIIENFSTMVTQNVEAASSMYGKRLTVLRYLLFDIISAINTFMFRVGGSKKQITYKDIEGAMNKFLRPDLIMRANNRHGEVNIISSPGDNKVFKITGNLVLQTDSSGGRGGKTKMSVSDPARWLHVSIAEVGSYGNLPKSSPDGRGRINPYVHVGPDGLIQRSEEHRALLNNIQRKIER